MTAPWALRRPRLCEATTIRSSRWRRTWDTIRRDHICDRQRSFAHEHIGRHICECGVRWE